MGSDKAPIQLNERITMTNYKLLKAKIHLVYSTEKASVLNTEDKSIENALKIYRTIKEYERKYCHVNDIEEAPNYEKELNEAKSDLVDIFGFSIAEIKEMTKNNLYLNHQSKLVNSIYIMLEKGDL